MRSSGQVAQKLKQLRFRHLKKEIKMLLRQTPGNCKNHTILGPSTKWEIGVCKEDLEVCDEMVCDRSKECGIFSAKHSKDEVKSSLMGFFRTRGPRDISVRFPDVATLMWVLDEEKSSLDFFPGSTLVREVEGHNLWADSSSEAGQINSHIEGLERHLRLLSVEANDLRELADQQYKEIQLLQKQMEDKEEVLSVSLHQSTGWKRFMFWK